ncbi:hypothetical protein DICPUDRAFT_98134 [Dictyostelium purpureum]|uniref:Uncharacterized protein n=1 Tax=Dictyostelium purpureum TaxID=5786 RepID=F0ZMZ7_DICPU|nr:uncharacterized protein DICPUDRAFT_98134 [Dictyostelium purpureum]EGC34706.1 hypothetical protein DICPUDRAFT_98134 [Dictyostelium purpureum]|eukprot:XP_003288791.1 hypothetical protein DICPUDRAFT_98134 [Dictyostelium purpureum]
MDEDPSIVNDPKNKQFNEDINSILLLFSKSTEWADFVKCLSKFGKLFDKYPKSTYIQSKLMVSKRLSQCLNPSLPSGCHMKALETYDLIFTRIGQERLSRDISIYATGLFPLFHLASTNVRVKIIQLYEKHIIPLGSRLISCLNGVVSSILPGLEENQGEAYEQVKNLLDSLSQSTATTLFYQALWKTLITTPYNRLSALNYLLLRLPKQTDVSNQLMYLPEKDTLVSQAIANSLSDSKVLVQRNTLELITVHFPLSLNIFSMEALESLVRSAIMVVTHKDMSLNKRLYTWLLEDKSSNQPLSNREYFEKYGKAPTVNAFKRIFRKTLDFLEYFDSNQQFINLNSTMGGNSNNNLSSFLINSIVINNTPVSPSNDNSNNNSNNSNQPIQQINNKEALLNLNNIILPFKVLIYFFEKEEFQVIIKDILPDILKYIYIFKDGYSFSKQIVKYTDDLLESIADQGAIWEFFGQMLLDQPSLESIKLVECILDIMHLSNEEVQSSYLPGLLGTMIKSLYNILELQDHQLIIAYTQLLLKITGKIIIDTPQSLNCLIQSIESYQDYFLKISNYIQEQYEILNQQSGNIVQQSQPLQNNILLSSPQAIPQPTPQSPTSSPKSSLNNNTVQQYQTQQQQQQQLNSELFLVLDLSFQLLVGLISQFKSSTTSPSQSPQQTSPALESTPKWFYPVLRFCESDNPFISCLAIKTFINLANKHGDMTMSRSFKNIITSEHFNKLSKKLWSLLDPTYSTIHYRVASLFCSLRELNEHAVSVVMADAMLDSDLSNRIEGYQKFALLWRLTGELGNSSLAFSNTLFLMLDSLSNDEPVIRLTGHTWLADSISRAERILDPLLKILLDKSTIRFNNLYQSVYDTRRVIYVFKILKTIIECDFKLFIQHVIEKPISKDVIALNDQQAMNYRESPKLHQNYISNQTNSPTLGGGDSTYNGFKNNNQQQQQQQQQNQQHNQQQMEASSDFLFMPTNSYIDLLIIVALRFIQGQVPTSIASHHNGDTKSFVSQNEVVQICAAEFLQYLLAKTSIQPSKAQDIANYIQDPILQNLAQAVSTSNMVLQVHLLSLLRSIVLIDSTSSYVSASPTFSLSPSLDNHHHHHHQQQQQSNPLSNSMGSTSLTSITQSQMFLQTTVVGLIQPSTRFNIRFYWLDFITFCLPRMTNSVHLSTVVTTIVNCLRDILGSFESRTLYDSITSRDIIVILKSLTFIFNFSILEPATSFDKVNQEETQQSHRSALGVKIFTDFVKDVFTSDIDASVTLTPIGQVRKDIFAVLADVFSPFLKIWGQPKSSGQNKISISTDVSSDTHNKFAIQDLILHILDPFMLKYPQQFIEAMVELWQRNEVSPSIAMISSSPSISNISSILNSGSSNNTPNTPSIGTPTPRDLESIQNRKVIMEIINSLESIKEESIFSAAHQILGIIRNQERSKLSKTILHKLTMKESSLYDFVYKYIEEYSSQFDGVSIAFLSFIKESLHSSNPVTFVSLLQILNIYIKKLTPDEKTKNPNRAKLNKRELQDLLPKIVDACFLISGRGFSDISAMYIPPSSSTQSNSNSSIGSGNSLANTPPSLAHTSSSSDILANSTLSFTSSPLTLGSNAPPNRSSVDFRMFQESGYIPSSVLQTLPSAYTSSSTPIGEDARGRSSSGGESDPSISAPTKLKKEANRLKSQVSLKALISLANVLAPLLDSIFDDKEKINTILANSLHNVSAYLRAKTPDVTRDNTFYTACLFSSLSDYSYNLKSIKKEVIDLFHDQDFFKNDLKTLEQISKFLNQTMIHDKTALSDFTKLLHKPWSSSSSLMFTSKDTENLNRAKQLKRLSFLIYSGTENQYLSILPLVQEKIVEALKIPNAPVLHLQVFFCLRVLLVRISHQNLRSFWPIIITELIDILSHSDNHDLVFAACKFLDLALTLPTITEQFNLFEWVFVKDCFVKHSQEPPFHPFVDQIANNKQPPTKEQQAVQQANIDTQLVLTSSGIIETQLFDAPYLRPCIMLRNVNELPSGFNEFKSFLSNFSNCIYSRHLQTSKKSVDYKFINELLCFDFCELDTSKLSITPDSILTFEKKQYHQRQHIKLQLKLLEEQQLELEQQQQQQNNQENNQENNVKWIKSNQINNTSPRSRAISISRDFDHLNLNNNNNNNNNTTNDSNIDDNTN